MYLFTLCHLCYSLYKSLFKFQEPIEKAYGEETMKRPMVEQAVPPAARGSFSGADLEEPMVKQSLPD